MGGLADTPAARSSGAPVSTQGGRSADAVRVGLAETVQQLPEHLWQSLTWDQGKEMAQHAQFTIDTGVQV